MAYKFLKGVFVDDNLLNQYEAQGYHLVKIDEKSGFYDILFSNTPFGGGSAISDITYDPVTRTMTIIKNNGTTISIDIGSGECGSQGTDGAQ